MTLVEHARRELERLGEEPAMIDWYCRVVAEFVSFGHSGGSAMVAIPVLHDLLQFRPLTPLTDDPAEWEDRSAMSGQPWWQNIRDGRAMSHDGGLTYWLVDEDAGDGVRPLHHAQPARPDPLEAR